MVRFEPKVFAAQMLRVRRIGARGHRPHSRCPSLLLAPKNRWGSGMKKDGPSGDKSSTGLVLRNSGFPSVSLKDQPIFLLEPPKNVVILNDEGQSSQN